MAGAAGAARAASDAALVIDIRAAHKLGRGAYGSPRVHAELQAKGVRVSEKRIARLMQEDGLRARQKRRFRKTTDSNHTDPIAPNVLQRAFEPKAPNRAWATDVTYVHTMEGWLYLAVMLDLFSRRVVGWAVSITNDRSLALDALNCALVARHPLPGLVHHSDRGSPYASEDYRQALQKRGIVASMSRTGDCWDNAVAESFFASLKAELVDHENYASHALALASIGDYIENFYNPLRRHSHLGYLNPIEYELRARVAVLAA
jgi:putative transposase